MIDLAGAKLSMMAGIMVPRPVSSIIMDAFVSADIALSDSKKDGFSVCFSVSQSGVVPGVAPILAHPDLNAGSRVVLSALIGLKPKVLIDGIIDQREVIPATGTSPPILKITGRDLSFVMDKEVKQMPHPSMSHNMIAQRILLEYSQYMIVPKIIPPLVANVPLATQRVPHQDTTDLQYLSALASDNGYVFKIRAGPVPGVATAFWGPKLLGATVQRAINVNMGGDSNATNVRLVNKAGQAKHVRGMFMDDMSGVPMPAASTVPVAPPLALDPSLLNPITSGVSSLKLEAGADLPTAMVRAQAQSSRTTETMQVSGDLDTLKYNDVLSPMNLVGLRGVGLRHGGMFFVRDVIHKIRPGRWSQSFTLGREGETSTTPIVVP